MRYSDHRRDAASGGETGDKFGAARLDDGDEIVHDRIGGVLVKNALIAKLLQIQF